MCQFRIARARLTVSVNNHDSSHPGLKVNVVIPAGNLLQFITPRIMWMVTPLTLGIFTT